MRRAAVLWHGEPVGRLVAGESMLTPRVELRAADFLDGEARERVRQRLASFRQGRDRSPPRAALRRPGAAARRRRARLSCSSLSTRSAVSRPRDVAAPLKALDITSRRALGRLGVRFGRETIYVEPLLGIDAVRFRALLWAVRHGRAVPRLPGARSRGKAIAVDPDLPASFYAAIGRRVIAGLALRPDRLERLAAAARGRARLGRFAGDAELAAIAGVAPGELRGVLLALGYRAVIEEGDEFFIAKPRRRGAPPPIGSRPKPPREGHPFAKLKELKFA